MNARLETSSESVVESAAGLLEELRAVPPLVHCITNAVVTGFTANVLLALGAAPAMVDITGEAGIRYDATDAQMAVDLVAMARPVTKWATRVVDPASLLRVLRRAVKMAATPPMGPVFVCLPADVLDAPNDEPASPTISRLAIMSCARFRSAYGTVYDNSAQFPSTSCQFG